MSQWLPGVAIGIFGLVLLILGIVARVRAQRVKTWPTAPATILHSEVKQHTSYNSKSRSRRTTYQPVVNYQYSVMGQPFNGDRVGFGNSGLSSRKAYEIVGRYPAGAQVNVHYNPDKIQESALEASALGNVLNIILGAGMILIGLMLLIML